MWREHIGMAWGYVEQRKTVDYVMEFLPPGEPPAEVKAEYDQLIAAALGLDAERGGREVVH